MAKIRFGYSDDFTAKNSKVGINTTESQTNLDVVGVVKGQDLKVTGVSSQTGYEGFLRADHQIEENTQLNFGQGVNSSLSGEIIVGTGQTVTINEVAKETVAVGNNSNTLWHNLVPGGHSGIIDRSPADKGAFWNGEYFDLDGSNDVITGESCLTLFTDDTDHTIEMWVKFDDVTTRSTIISGYKSGDVDRWDLEVSSGKLKGGHHEQGYFTSTASVITGKWYHLVYVHDHASSLWRVFIDTATDVTYANASKDLTSDIELGIGDRKDSSIGHLNGQISIVRIYKRELTSTEISTNYNLGPFSKETSVTDGLITHYNASNPSSYPGTLGTVDTTDTNIAGGSQIECMKVYNTFTPPSGDTNQRPSKPKPGQLYYNYDFKTIEFHDGYGWRQVDNTTQSGRAIFSGGATPADVNVIDYYNIHTTGNAMEFGDATITESRKSGCSSATRGLSAGSDDSGNHEVIDYVTIASEGNAIDFGDMYNGRGTAAGMSSSTRGLWGGGRSPGTNQDTIDYVEIATKGGTAEDFGDITVARQWLAGCSSSTRGIIAGGENNPFFPSPGRTSRIDFITMASKGDALIFGDLTAATGNPGGCSNSTRGFFGGGEPQTYSKIDMITIASTGNAIHFGDLTYGRFVVNGAGSQTRATFLGGHVDKNTIDYITMSTGGDAQDFGDLTVGRWAGASFSDSHGGLGGF